MKKISLSRNWLFKRQSDTDYVNIDLPHDYSVTMPRSADAAGGAANGFFRTDIGYYVKYLIPDNDASHFILDIDGAYMCTSVYF